MRAGNLAEAGLYKAKKGRRGVVALGGNPNVGKSTVFNELTGMRQHTGNWSGKTVGTAAGICEFNGNTYELVDLPGCYSLMSHSAEEKAARDFICRGNADAVIIVCDATCLERSLNIVLQTLEMTPNVVVCVNLIDEAVKKQIKLNLKAISRKLGVPVVGTAARSNSGLDELMLTVERVIEHPEKQNPVKIIYPEYIEEAISKLSPYVKRVFGDLENSRRFSLMLLQNGEPDYEIKENEYGISTIKTVLAEIREDFSKRGITLLQLKDDIVSSLIRRAEIICQDSIVLIDENYKSRDIKIDGILTGKMTAFPLMILALLGIFWLTITGANYPSQIISGLLFRLEYKLLDVFAFIKAPDFLRDMLVLGVYRVLAWVVSVMLPPMAIFFPLFTLLEDAGFLPRIAFNLDKCFKKCSACGKQALTMCMGFGCNAAGVTGCRIIDSPRERLIAIITNNFAPCNGRFPALIAIISMFFTGYGAGLIQSFLSAAFLTGIIVLGVILTFISSHFLSRTILKGMPSSFTLELPPYRRPQICKVIVRSIFDRTLFVLMRAVSVAAPAGLLIWLIANLSFGNVTLLARFSGFLDPFAHLMGLDGVILLAFILGFPANEIVLPIIIMAYMAEGSILSIDDLSLLKQLLVDNGWTWLTALNVMLFSLVHWPCSTTCLTIKKETGSWKWTAISIALPTLMGILICVVINTMAKFMGIL